MDNPEESKMASQSPVPHREAPARYLFIDAFKELLNGRKITRLAWNNTEEYCLLRDEWVSIYRFGKFHTWQISLGDVEAEDWILLPEVL